VFTSSYLSWSCSYLSWNNSFQFRVAAILAGEANDRTEASSFRPGRAGAVHEQQLSDIKDLYIFYLNNYLCIYLLSTYLSIYLIFVDLFIY
jgi:hypothetical protein